MPYWLAVFVFIFAMLSPQGSVLSSLEAMTDKPMISKKSRTPASIPSALGMTNSELKIDCNNKEISMLVSYEGLKLSGEICGKQNKIFNRKNGFEANIFPLAENKYITDIVQLSPGENLVEYEWIDKTGSTKKKQLRLTR